MSPSSPPRYLPFAGPGLFLLSLLTYLVTLSPDFFPGRSAGYVVAQLELDPFPPLTNPIWGLLVKLLDAIPLLSLPVLLNFMGALFGAASVWLFYSLVSRIPHDRTAEGRRDSHPT